MAAHTEPLAQMTHEAAALRETGRALPVHAFVQAILFKSIVQGVFGPAANPALSEALSALTEKVVNSRLLLAPWLQRDWGRLSPWGRLVRRVRAADEAVYETLRGRRASAPDGRDSPRAVLGARDAKGEALSDKEIRDEAITMIVAGHEITSISVAWALAAIAAHPTVQQAVQRELDQVVERVRSNTSTCNASRRSMRRFANRCAATPPSSLAARGRCRVPSSWVNTSCLEARCSPPARICYTTAKTSIETPTPSTPAASWVRRSTRISGSLLAVEPDDASAWGSPCTR